MAEIGADAPGRRLTIGRFPVGSVGRRASGWWGMLTVVLTEAFLFAYLFFSYYYFAVQYGRTWLPPELPSFWLSVPSTAILLASSVAIWSAERGIRQDHRGRLVLGLLITLALGAAFVGIELYDWSSEPFTLASSAYGSLYFTTAGFHLIHVAVGLLILVALLVWSALGYFDLERFAPVSIGALYWHFVVVVWLAEFFTFYITPYLS